MKVSGRANPIEGGQKLLAVEMYLFGICAQFALSLCNSCEFIVEDCTNRKNVVKFVIFA